MNKTMWKAAEAEAAKYREALNEIRGLAVAMQLNLENGFRVDVPKVNLPEEIIERADMALS